MTERKYPKRIKNEKKKKKEITLNFVINQMKVFDIFVRISKKDKIAMNNNYHLNENYCVNQ